MKDLLILAAVAALASLPPFTFAEHRAGANYDTASLLAAGCKQDGATFECVTRNRPVAGHWAIVTYLIANRRLATLSIAGDREALPDVFAAFSTRYGTPCDQGTETLINGLGNSFQSATTTWCFNSGKMILHDRGVTMSTYLASYTDDVNRLPSANPPVDF